ncbi:MAG: hypothetical protein Q8Q30_02370 [Candidatus Woesebacteria bacterium]|nr:hypothetical protein [Candidatus Woesebacteria bacterium]
MTDTTILMERNGKLVEVQINESDLVQVLKAINYKSSEIIMNRGFYENFLKNLPGLENFSDSIVKVLSNKER